MIDPINLSHLQSQVRVLLLTHIAADILYAKTCGQENGSEDFCVEEPNYVGMT